MKISVLKMREALVKRCPHCSRELAWQYKNGAVAMCCGKRYRIEPKVVTFIEEEAS